MTQHLWGISRRFFIFHYFLPFVLLESVPLVVMSFNTTIKDNLLLNMMIDCTCVILLAVGTGMNIVAEINQYRKEGLKWYAGSAENYYQWLMIFVNIALVLQVVSVVFRIIGTSNSMEASNVNEIYYVINGMVFAIQLNVLEFFYRVRIFNFFAYFVRQLQEICYDSLPLASMLAFIVITQSLLFWTLDQNADESHYQGFKGFFGCLVDSYRLALGDFVLTEKFGGHDGNSDENMITFWLVFFVGTLISMLIILNMVIAVMSATFERVAAETQA